MKGVRLVPCHYRGPGPYTRAMALKTLDEFLATIPEGEKRDRMIAVLDWVREHYPQLELRIAWNQPMFTDHGTMIVGFSAATKHMAMAPERHTMIHFEDEMKARGTDFGKMFARQPWAKPFDYELLGMFIDYQLETKKNVTSFWMPQEQ